MFYGNDLEIKLSFYDINWLSLIQCFMNRIVHKFSRHRIDPMYRIVNIRCFQCNDVYRTSLHLSYEKLLIYLVPFQKVIPSTVWCFYDWLWELWWLPTLLLIKLLFEGVSKFMKSPFFLVDNSSQTVSYLGLLMCFILFWILLSFLSLMYNICWVFLQYDINIPFF